MQLNSRRALGIVALLCLCLSVTLALQAWVGDRTIYAESLEYQREELHQSILTNRAPGGASWAAAGALSIQKRVGVVYLAEGISKATGWSVGKTYKALDTLFLFATLVGFFFYLRRWLPAPYSLIGLLYLCTFLPLTYFFQLFHPWDRLQLLIWILLLYLVAERKFFLLLVVLIFSIVVKFDTILLPALYFFVHLGRAGWRRLATETAVLMAAGLSVNAALNGLFPDPAAVSRFSMSAVLDTLSSNVNKFLTMNHRYPPLLSHFLPVCLALIGLRSRDRFVLMCVLFGLALSVIHFLLTNYEEVRAHMMVIILVAPAALMTVRSWLEPQAENAKP